MCGGTIDIFARRAHAGGLSPRVRGNLAAAGEHYLDLGSIPACAGEPAALLVPHNRSRVYPRVCGGTLYPVAPVNCRLGLSPRVRGNQSGLPCPQAAIRSIPACAGEPPGMRSRMRSLRVYPRVCGGTSSGCSAGLVADGLSPRVRGNQSGLPCPQAAIKSIPACAGEPAGAQFYAVGYEVYPRVCGGTQEIRPTYRGKRGLSPRVRGNRTPAALHSRPGRSIPACAGEPHQRIVTVPYL